MTEKTAKADLSSDWQDFYWIRRFVEAGVDRKRIYATNAVKRFKFEPGGKGGCTNVFRRSRR